MSRIRNSLGLVTMCAVLVIAAGCGGGAAGSGGERVSRKRSLPPRKAGAPEVVEAAPLEVKIAPHRTGDALELAITIVARGHEEGEPFEDPDGWQIEVSDQRGDPLRRLMNGPRRIVRAPVGREDGSQWDVTVKHSIFFHIADGVARVQVKLNVPGAKPYEMAAPVPESPDGDGG